MVGVRMGLGEGLEVKLGVWVKVTYTYTHKGNGWYSLLSDAFATIPFWHFLGF